MLLRSDSKNYILYCNPNAECYEYLKMTSEWIEFYKGKVNLILWNFRGYGDSQGTPDPKTILEDSESIIKHFYSKDIKIGVHGQSMGGIVAAHLAKKGIVDFILCDRTFKSLDKMVYYLYGPYCEFLFKLFTFWKWNVSLPEKFVYANCYKVIACDAKDDLVIEAASLKVGVSHLIIKSETE